MLILLAAFLAGSSDAASCSGGYGCAEMSLTVGVVKGNAWEDGEEYLTIPYASAERFEAPVVSKGLPGGGTFDATNILPLGQAACMQAGYGKNESYGREDCLILNLYKPRDDVRSASSALRPVILWIFGGDNILSEIIPYNATKLAGKHNAVVVVVSYRLGGLGFAAFAEDSSSPHGTGNSGMLDILAAASWVKREAHNLGVDPNRIVAVGESSGAADAAILTFVPAAKGLISGSISESGGLYSQNLTGAIANTKRMAKAVGCTGTREPIKKCMQKKKAADIVSAASKIVGDHWGPTADGTFLPDDPHKLLAAGRLNPGTSVLWGMNTNDSAHPLGPEYVSEEKFVEQLNRTVHGYRPPEVTDQVEDSTLEPSRNRGQKKILGGRSGARHQALALGSSIRGGAAIGNATALASGGVLLADDQDDNLLARALEIYPPRHLGQGPDHLGNNAALIGWFNSDRALCSSLRDMRLAAKAVSAGGRAFMYRFDWFFQSSKTCVADSNYHNPSSGSNHCDEMTFVFGQPIFDNQDAPGYSYTNCSDPASAYYDKERCVGCAFDAREAKFALAIGAFWTNFAATGDPNGGSHERTAMAAVRWPAFTESTPQNIVLHPDATRVESNMGRTKACALWDEVERRFPGE
jgi:carboxylesterase type B